MNLDVDDKEFINAIQAAHYAKIDSSITILSAKLDAHIITESQKDIEIETIKTDIVRLNTESAKHKQMRKWQYAAIIIGIAIATLIVQAIPLLA